MSFFSEAIPGRPESKTQRVFLVHGKGGSDMSSRSKVRYWLCYNVDALPEVRFTSITDGTNTE